MSLQRSTGKKTRKKRRAKRILPAAGVSLSSRGRIVHKQWKGVVAITEQVQKVKYWPVQRAVFFRAENRAVATTGEKIYKNFSIKPNQKHAGSGIYILNRPF